jgi:hypothetical protein
MWRDTEERHWSAFGKRRLEFMEDSIKAETAETLMMIQQQRGVDVDFLPNFSEKRKINWSEIQDSEEWKTSFASEMMTLDHEVKLKFSSVFGKTCLSTSSSLLL